MPENYRKDGFKKEDFEIDEFLQMCFEVGYENPIFMRLAKEFADEFKGLLVYFHCSDETAIDDDEDSFAGYTTINLEPHINTLSKYASIEKELKKWISE